MLDGMSDSIQRSRIENLHSREVDCQSPTGLIFNLYVCKRCCQSYMRWGILPLSKQSGFQQLSKVTLLTCVWHNNSNNQDDIYSAVIMTRSLREYTRFSWWPPTLRPSHMTWAASPPVLGS